MENITKDAILKFHEDTVQAVRKDIGLDEPGRMEEAIDMLDDWIKKQAHFVKKDFPREYLERILIVNKGSVEKSKRRLDKLCTFKTLMPEYFNEDFDPQEIIDSHASVIVNAHLPILTKDHHRIFVVQLATDDFDSKTILYYYKYTMMLSEYLIKSDYNSGFIIIIDARVIKNMVQIMTRINPMDLKQHMTSIQEGYGLRIKGIHIITESKTAEVIVSLFKQAVSDKIANRIHVHKDIDTLFQFVPKDILPEEYGGKESPLKELNKKWTDLIKSKENVEYFKMMCKAATNENYRMTDKFNQEYCGVPGSFRVMKVD